MVTPIATDPDPWLALVVGNTRCHWVWVQGDRPLAQWHTRHLRASDCDRLIQSAFAPEAWYPLLAGAEPPPAQPVGRVPLHGATVVPQQGALWASYPQWHPITLRDVPLGNCYDTLGCDRALAVWAAGLGYGGPVLVVDGGTALTVTAGDRDGLVGGAIWPGLRLQFQSLGQQTASLPTIGPTAQAETAQTSGPVEGAAVPAVERWARDTPSAIRSGIYHSLRATVTDWLHTWSQQYPQGAILFTGGDGPQLCTLLGLRSQGQSQPLPSLTPAIAARATAALSHPLSLPPTVTLYHCPLLPFWGITAQRQLSG